jgi:hypothetical protein
MFDSNKRKSNMKSCNWFKTTGKTTAPFVTIVRQLMDVNCVRYSFARHQKAAVTVDHALISGIIQ